MVTLEPTFAYMWCLDSDRVSPLILVGPWFWLTPRPPWGRGWPGLILPIVLASLTSNTGHPFGESTYPSWAPFAVSPFSVTGVWAFSLFGYLWGSDGRGVPFPLIRLGSILSWVSVTPHPKSLAPGDP
jgi:hypothetical protein